MQVQDLMDCLIVNLWVKLNNIDLNRKVLADLAMNHPSTFKEIVEKIK
jgi:ribosomal protein L20